MEDDNVVTNMGWTYNRLSTPAIAFGLLYTRTTILFQLVFTALCLHEVGKYVFTHIAEAKDRTSTKSRSKSRGFDLADFRLPSLPQPAPAPLHQLLGSCCFIGVATRPISTSSPSLESKNGSRSCSVAECGYGCFCFLRSLFTHHFSNL